jgi:hypothetical protein
MTNFRDRDQLQERLQQWLQGKSRQAVIVFTARAVLRALPGIAGQLAPEDISLQDKRRSVILPVFRAAATTWVAARYPAHRGGELTHSAKLALDAASFAGIKIADAARAGAYAAATHGMPSSAAAAVDAAVSVFQASALSAITSDARALDHGAKPAELAGHPLWPNGANRPVRDSWRKLSRALLKAGEHWEVWTDWYEARLEGQPSTEGLELARVTIVEELWRLGPGAVNAHIKELTNKFSSLPQLERATRQLKPLDYIPSPFAFDCSPEGVITLTVSSANWPDFPLPTSEQNHASRLEVCRELAQDLCSDLHAQKYNVRDDYSDELERYLLRLPKAPQEGNFLLADAHARTLRHLFAAEAGILPVSFAAKLQTLLENHIGLRVFYPEIATFYRNVQSGRIDIPLSLDAVEGFVQGIRENTPQVFDPVVKEMIEGSAETAPELSSMPEAEPTQLAENRLTQPKPPTDPLGEVDMQKARDFTFAGAANGLWKIFLDGEKIHKNLDGWKKAGATLRPHVHEILDWLYRFLGVEDGSPPLPPTVNV